MLCMLQWAPLGILGRSEGLSQRVQRQRLQAEGVHLHHPAKRELPGIQPRSISQHMDIPSLRTPSRKERLPHQKRYDPFMGAAMVSFMSWLRLILPSFCMSGFFPEAS